LPGISAQASQCRSDYQVEVARSTLGKSFAFLGQTFVEQDAHFSSGLEGFFQNGGRLFQIGHGLLAGDSRELCSRNSPNVS